MTALLEFMSVFNMVTDVAAGAAEVADACRADSSDLKGVDPFPEIRPDSPPPTTDLTGRKIVPLGRPRSPSTESDASDDSEIDLSDFLDSSTELSKKQVVLLDEKPAWHERAISCIEEFGRNWLNTDGPNNGLQDLCDDFYARTIEPMVNSSFIERINKALKHDKSESVGAFALKVIPRALKNLVVLVYQILKMIPSFLVHPSKFVIEALKFLVVLAHAATLPETWTGLGAGFIGASLGQLILAPGPQVVLGLIIGAALTAFGLAFGAVKAALEAEKGHRFEAVLHQLGHQLREMPEAMMTGFIVGIILGGLEQVIDPENPLAQAAGALDDLGALNSTLENASGATAAVLSS